jgi:hypothetical protein
MAEAEALLKIAQAIENLGASILFLGLLFLFCKKMG